MKAESLKGDFLKYLQEIKNFSTFTIESYERYMRHFFIFIGNQELENLKVEDIWKYKEFLKENLKHDNNTIHYHLIGLRKFLWFCKLKDLNTLPYEKVEVGRRIRRDAHYLMAEEVEKFLNSIEINSYKDLRDKAIIELLYSTGMRIGELLRLNRTTIQTTIDSEKKQFTIIGKGSKPRDVFLNDRAYEIIKLYLSTRIDNQEALFIGNFWKKKNTRISKSAIENIFKDLSKKTGIKVTPHVLRHSFATTLLINGADIYSIKEMLGHTYITTTQIYLHVSNKQLQNVHEKYLTFDK